MLVLGTEKTWGQTDYSGVYYIGSNSSKTENSWNGDAITTNYYLCPTEGWIYYKYENDVDDFTATDNGQPFLTTYQCRNSSKYDDVRNAVWTIQKHPTLNYYYIIHTLDGKYLTYNGWIRTTSSTNNRIRVHLQDSPSDNSLFGITYVNEGNYYNISAKGAIDANYQYQYLNVTDGNKDSKQGSTGKTDGPTGYKNVGGTIGIWSNNTTDYTGKFYLQKATIDPPTITNNETITNTFTITAASGATIYYTTNGDTPTTSTTTTGTTSVNVTQTEGMTVIKAIAKGASDAFASGVTTYNLPQCAKPVITISGGNVIISCATEGATIHYTINGDPATSSSTAYTAPFAKGSASTFRAISTKAGYINSNETTLLPPIEVSSSSQITNMSGSYILASNFSASGSIGTSDNPFRGTIDGAIDGELITRSLSYPLVAYADGATIKNVILDDINITTGNDNGNTGAICNEATGATRIYNCGVLATTSSTISGSGHVGSIVGSISGNTRVINCYSFANVNGGSYTAGIVGYNPVGTTQANVETAGMVMNCMFYGNITGSNISPVYGGEMIDNAGETGVNNYNYYRRNRYDKETDTYVDDVTFDNNMALADYHRSWPADAKYLTRFEYYRSILNSNKKLCTWWVNGTNGTAPSDADIEDVGIAKWVLDLSIAPYPILKKWGKYPSVINQDPDKRVNPSTKTWVDRANASDHWGKDMEPDTEGQILGTVTVSIDAGSHHSGSTSKPIKITAMDTEYNDYCYGKIQLPYYNEIFGNPDGDTWEEKYGGNYTAHVVTGWDISGGSDATDYNFADRNSYSGRVFAQGGYFYVPKGVTSISITAHWADAVYLCNKDYSVDRVNVGAGEKKNQNDNSATAPKKIPEYGSTFTPAGTISDTFHGQHVYETIKDAIGALSKTSSGKDVYNQAIVLIGNVQLRNHSSVYGATGTSTRPFTLMSADLDFDNEPDNCLELQFRNDIDRPGVQPIRFDFLPVPELGLAIRTNKLAYAIGIMIPLGHFEITETAFMHTTQFEYDGDVSRTGKSPVIINGGEHEMFTKRKQRSDATQRDRISYFLLGGNAWVHRFAPGAHPNTGDKPDIYLFPVNVIGGQVKELYLTGLYRPELPTGTSIIAGAPRCYIDGGKFDIIAGAGYDKVKSGENVTFKINHSLIKEFYGGGINASNPISGDIYVTIDNSRVEKYCGGPKVGNMTGHKVTTDATGTTFGVFYGGGNGGNSYYRQLQRDGDFASNTMNTNWESTTITKPLFNFNGFTPLGVKDDGTDNKGYHAEYEFEVFNQSNGLSDEVTQRGFIKWIQFGETTTGNVENTLENCKVLGNFYGGGNLATVNGNVTSTLTNTQVSGSAFGAGYSAAIPTFQVQNKEGKVFPSINDAGVITEGHIPYAATVYEWTNDLNGKSIDERKADPTYEKDDQWYCYTWNSLENLGTVTGDVTLTIDGNTVAGEDGKVMTVAKSVYGGGEESDVLGNTNVTMTGGYVFNGIFGGGYSGSVGTVTARSLVNYDGTAHTSHPGCVGGKPTAFEDGTGKCTVEVTGGQIGPIEVATKGMKRSAAEGGPVPEGWVWGGGCGIVADPETDPDTDFRTYVKETDVTIGGNAFILESIIGGGEFGRVLGNTHVTIEGNCQIGVGYEQEEDGRPKRYTNEQFVNPATTTITDDNALVPCSHYDYDKDNPLPYDPYYETYTSAQIGQASTSNPADGKTWIGCVFGGGSGYMPYKKADDSGYGWIRSAGVVEGNTLVEIKGGHILTNVYGGNEVTDVKGKCTVKMTGGTIGVPRTLEQIKANPFNGNLYGAGKGDPRTYFNEFTNVGSVEVDVSGGIIYGSVYGGGEDGHVTGNVTTTIRKETGEGKVAPVIGCVGTSGDDGNVFGAGQGSTVSLTSGVVSGNVELNIQDGNIKGSVYGGGQIGSVGTHIVRVDNENYGKMQTGDHGNLTVNLTGGTIHQNVYGGCMGTTEDIRFGVSKNVAVNLNKEVDDAAQGCAVKGSIFGCNNVNSSPQGTATVHIYKTQRAGKSRITNGGGVEDAKVPGTQNNGEYNLGSFDVQAVYGGGNLAAYTPIDATSTNEAKKKAAHTTVIIDGCGQTSIGQVYGGGNAASTPATEVTVNGTYEIGEVFGGGNGKDQITIAGVTKDNPGANVGFYDYHEVEDDINYNTKEKRETNETFIATYVYGSGEAAVNIYGGTIHRVFGGSNTKGNVRKTAVTMLEDMSTCDFCVDEAYGGGKSAPMDAEAKLLMSCVPGLNVAYGGAQAADVQNNVILNITNGTFDRVFGGNNISGTIRGSITVNIEETGCKPIIIGQLYGGGNLAGYSIYGYKEVTEGDKKVWKPRESENDEGTGPIHSYANPQINVKSFTSIGDIYGGGYGESAVMVGSPTVNIDVVNGKYYNDDNNVLGDDAETPNHYPVPSHAKGKMGAINNVFGGGNAAKVIGNTNVNIGTQSEVYVVKTVTVGNPVTDYYTRNNDGTYTAATGTAVEGTTYYEKKDVLGADIRGNVYGGGNAAEVTGKTNVQIGKNITE